MLFIILYIVMSVNRFDTKLWLLLNSLLDCFLQIKEKHVQISKFVLGFQAQLFMENGLDEYIIMIIFRLFIVIYVTLANMTERAEGNVS